MTTKIVHLMINKGSYSKNSSPQYYHMHNSQNVSIEFQTDYTCLIVHYISFQAFFQIVYAQHENKVNHNITMYRALNVDCL